MIGCQDPWKVFDRNLTEEFLRRSEVRLTSIMFCSSNIFPPICRQISVALVKVTARGNIFVTFDETGFPHKLSFGTLSILMEEELSGNLRFDHVTDCEVGSNNDSSHFETNLFISSLVKDRFQTLKSEILPENLSMEITGKIAEMLFGPISIADPISKFSFANKISFLITSSPFALTFRDRLGSGSPIIWQQFDKLDRFQHKKVYLCQKLSIIFGTLVAIQHWHPESIFQPYLATVPISWC